MRTRVQKGLEEWVAAGKPLKEVGLTSGPRRSSLGLGRLSFLVMPPPDPQAFLRGL
ncbi:hypothetical protein ACFU46_32110 [Streptomyces griseoincarnatus]